MGLVFILNINIKYKKIKLAIVVLCFIFICGILLYRNSFNFILSEWHGNEMNRIRLTHKLLDKIDIIGMTKAEVTNLLGDGKEKYTFAVNKNIYEPENTLVYFIGTDYLESIYLIIVFENDVAVNIEYGFS